MGISFAIDTFFQEIFGAFASNNFIFFCFVHDDTIMVSFGIRSNSPYQHTETRHLRFERENNLRSSQKYFILKPSTTR